MGQDPEPPCPFCKRPILRMMRHHTVPKSKGGRHVIDSCRDCHRAIHLFFTNATLARTHHTVEALMSDERFAKMVAFIAKQDPARKVRMRRPKQRA